MNITINPKPLKGVVDIPASKSVAHRMIICAALAQGKSVIKNVYPSKDIIATIEAMKALGAHIELKEDTATIRGIDVSSENAVIDCCESGSTLRFLIPVVCALGTNATFIGQGKLPQRPITPYLEEFPKHNVVFDYNNTMPFSVSGKLSAGKFYISGSISSQFITGLLLALPLLDGDSEIILTSHLESKPYVDITIGTIKDFGCEITETENGYYIKGNQHYKPFNGNVEGDYSQAAFFEVANLLGSHIEINGLNKNSFQGDKKIVEICREIVYNNNDVLKPFDLDCSDIPDLVPILTVLACFCNGISHITNVARLRIKECDRLEAISTCLNKIGANVKAYEDSLEITGVKELCGGVVDGYNDHRIPMSMAVAATRCTKPLTILGAQCVSKSYPDFFEVYKKIGGDISAD